MTDQNNNTPTTWTPCCTRLISKTLVTALLLSTTVSPPAASAFTQNSPCTRALHHSPSNSATTQSINNNNNNNNNPESLTQRTHQTSDTRLNVWWFGGTDNSARTEDEELCELVAVRIERPSSNSRRIAGSISVPRPVEDVWAILTDYDNLSVHVPNLVESRQINPSLTATSQPGDGEYTCRLYQKGAQKIVGFEFGASVTMDMSETIRRRDTREESREIGFRCVESQFFSEFDGYWRVTPSVDPEDPTAQISEVEYVVLVKPRGPVPVAALEWRIREDVPTNLRAVKLAATELGKQGVLELRKTLRDERNGRTPLPGNGAKQRIKRFTSVASATRRSVGNTLEAAVVNVQERQEERRFRSRLAPVRVSWEEDETMATYLKNKRN